MEAMADVNKPVIVEELEFIDNKDDRKDQEIYPIDCRQPGENLDSRSAKYPVSEEGLSLRHQSFNSFKRSKSRQKVRPLYMKDLKYRFMKTIVSCFGSQVLREKAIDWSVIIKKTFAVNRTTQHPGKGQLKYILRQCGRNFIVQCEKMEKSQFKPALLLSPSGSFVWREHEKQWIPRHKVTAEELFLAVKDESSYNDDIVQTAFPTAKERVVDVQDFEHMTKGSSIANEEKNVKDEGILLFDMSDINKNRHPPPAEIQASMLNSAKEVERFSSFSNNMDKKSFNAKDLKYRIMKTVTSCFSTDAFRRGEVAWNVMAEKVFGPDIKRYRSPVLQMKRVVYKGGDNFFRDCEEMEKSDFKPAYLLSPFGSYIWRELEGHWIQRSKATAEEVALAVHDVSHKDTTYVKGGRLPVKDSNHVSKCRDSVQIEEPSMTDVEDDDQTMQPTDQSATAFIKESRIPVKDSNHGVTCGDSVQLEESTSADGGDNDQTMELTDQRDIQSGVSCSPAVKEKRKPGSELRQDRFKPLRGKWDYEEKEIYLRDLWHRTIKALTACYDLSTINDRKFQYSSLSRKVYGVSCLFRETVPQLKYLMNLSWDVFLEDCERMKKSDFNPPLLFSPTGAYVWSECKTEWIPRRLVSVEDLALAVYDENYGPVLEESENEIYVKYT